MRFIWATRGRNWGFRFLNRGGLTDPLPTYSLAFAGLEGVNEVCRPTEGMTAVRFEDPLERRDRVRRIIPHDFVILDEVSGSINSLASAIEMVWPLVEAAYARDYARDEPEGLDG